MTAIAVATLLQVIGWTVLALVGFGLMALVVMIRNAGDDEWDDEPEPKPVGPPRIPRRRERYVYPDHGRSEEQRQRLADISEQQSRRRPVRGNGGDAA